VLELNSPVSAHSGAVQSPFNRAAAQTSVVSNMPESHKAFGCKKGGSLWCGKTPVAFGRSQIAGHATQELRFQARSDAAESEYLGSKRFIAAANASAAARTTSTEV
jgi:hypothetical protein